MKRKSRAAFPLLIALLLSGCSTLYKRVDPGMGEVDKDEIAFKAGQTHYHDVLDQLGPPSRLSSMGEGFAFLYEAMLIRELQTGIGGQSGFWQLLKFSFADSKLFRHTAMLTFNDDGILISAAYSDTAEPLGRSGAIQPILTVQQIVDTTRFEDDAVDVVDWGMSMLAKPPETLNVGQSLSSGTGGFEQSGTTTRVGQHTLEMRKE